MEDNTKVTNPNSSSTDNSERTVIMSSNQNQGKQKPVDQEKTQISAPKSETNLDSQSDSGEAAKDFVIKNKNKNKKSISPGMAVGGATVSGIAGVAVGVGLSEEIKEVFANPISHGETNGLDEIPVVEETSIMEESTSNEANTSIEAEYLVGLEIDESHKMEFSYSDNQGNVFSVSFLDINGDGQIENQTLKFELVDGTSISYSESGIDLEPFFSESFHLAEYIDYVDAGYCSVAEVSMMDSFLYQIQPGDTLSEIAAANNTSIANLMELNPQISDSNMIFAGHNLIIPQGDNISNPYENWSQVYDSPLLAEESYFIEENEITSTGEFASIDWESYYDNPVQNPYTSELAEIDFETMETPQSYYETDFDMGDYGMEESGFGFL
jgi:LysM repeat protein